MISNSTLSAISLAGGHDRVENDDLETYFGMRIEEIHEIVEEDHKIC